MDHEKQAMDYFYKKLSESIDDKEDEVEIEMTMGFTTTVMMHIKEKTKQFLDEKGVKKHIMIFDNEKLVIRLFIEYPPPPRVMIRSKGMNSFVFPTEYIGIPIVESRFMPEYRERTFSLKYPHWWQRLLLGKRYTITAKIKLKERAYIMNGTVIVSDRVYPQIKAQLSGLTPPH
jgi:hypothetical protein